VKEKLVMMLELALLAVHKLHRLVRVRVRIRAMVRVGVRVEVRGVISYITTPYLNPINH
jgi:uncharacterized protein YggT (Ycf19 family)